MAVSTVVSPTSTSPTTSVFPGSLISRFSATLLCSSAKPSAVGACSTFWMFAPACPSVSTPAATTRSLESASTAPTFAATRPSPRTVPATTISTLTLIAPWPASTPSVLTATPPGTSSARLGRSILTSPYRRRFRLASASNLIFVASSSTH